MKLQRRPLLAMALMASLASACSSPTPPGPPGVATRSQALQNLGFVETPEGWELDLASRVQFEFGAVHLQPEGIAVVHRLGLNLLEIDVRSCRIEGHADDVGTDAFNLQLSERRAQVVAKVLAQAGMPASQLSIRGHGKRKPIADNQTEAGRLKNRRVVVIVPAQN